MQQNESEEQSKQQPVQHDESEEQSKQQPVQQSLSGESSLGESSSSSDWGWPPRNSWKDEIRELHEEFPESVICEQVLPSLRGCQLAKEQEQQKR